MSFVINNVDAIELNIANAYQNYLKEKAVELAKHYENKYHTDSSVLAAKLSDEKLELKDQLEHDLLMYQQKLSEVNQNQVSSLVDFLDEKLSFVIDKILLKLGVYNISTTQISDLIREELGELLKSRTVNVRANADTINYLKFCVELNGFIDSYEEDDNVPEGRCVISDGMCVCLADLASAATKIKQLFKTGETK